ncbi:MAG TPA: hypothetical protein VLI06_10695, partial [Solimonas sp.]|nr:hypothetical protein [Solimonas sp.]
VPTAPGALLIAMVRLTGLFYRLLRRKPPASAAGIRFLQRRGAYSIAKAQRLLGYTPKIGLEQGMRGVAAELERLRAS